MERPLKKNFCFRAVDFKQIHSQFVDDMAFELIDRSLVISDEAERNERDLFLVLPGLTPMGEKVLLEIAKMYHFIGIKHRNIGILDNDANQKLNFFLKRYPDIVLLPDIHFLTLENSILFN